MTESLRMDRPLHLLIVDDRPDSVFLLSEFLLKRHHRVEVSNDTRESLGAIQRRRARSDPYDLVLCNVRMPELDGIAMLRELRGKQDPTPVALIDAFGDVDAVAYREAEALVCLGFLDKPIELSKVDQLLEKVRHLHSPHPVLHPPAQPAQRPATQATQRPAAQPTQAAQRPATQQTARSPTYTPTSERVANPAEAYREHRTTAAHRPSSAGDQRASSAGDHAVPPVAPAQQPPSGTLQRKQSGDDQPFFGTARVVRPASTGASDRLRAQPAQPVQPPLQPLSLDPDSPLQLQPSDPLPVHPLTPNPIASPAPRAAAPSGNPFTDFFPAPSQPAPPPEPPAGRLDTARLRRAVTGRVDRPSAVDPAIAKKGTGLERKVACAKCHRDFLVANRDHEFTVMCLHCGQPNRVQPRSSR